jgi:hypothetical protein
VTAPIRKVYRDENGNAIALLALCQKDPNWAANVIAMYEERLARIREAHGLLHRCHTYEGIALLDEVLGAYVHGDREVSS